MTVPSLTASSDEAPFDGERDYLLDMIQQLAKLARAAGEIEVEILLRAILDINRARARRLDRMAVGSRGG